MKCLINETTKEERIEMVQKALSISLSGADVPSKYMQNLIEDYIEGRKELEEIKKIIIEKYKNDAIDGGY